jgi:hypothetical protein
LKNILSKKTNIKLEDDFVKLELLVILFSHFELTFWHFSLSIETAGLTSFVGLVNYNEQNPILKNGLKQFNCTF